MLGGGAELPIIILYVSIQEPIFLRISKLYVNKILMEETIDQCK